MPPINQRIRDLIKIYSKGRVTDFGKRIGRDYQIISRLFKIDTRNGNFPEPSSDIISAIINTFTDLRPDWLIKGEEPMLKTESNYTDKIIPYYPDINANAGLEFLTSNGHNYSIPIMIPNTDVEAFINVFGDSMYPKYCAGEIIGIKKIEKDMLFFGNAYVVEMINGEAYIKYIDPGKDEDHWILRSENPNYREKQFHLEKIRGVYLIKAVITKATLL